MGSHPANLAFRFVLEITALVGIGILGWSSVEGWVRGLLAVALPLIAAAVWGTFAVPEDPSRSGSAPVPIRGWVRLILESVIFSLGVAGYALTGREVFASVVLGLVEEETALPQTVGGHMRLVIGYNPRREQILYTDTWGAGHELKRMSVEDAVTMTTAMYTIWPR